MGKILAFLPSLLHELIDITVSESGVKYFEVKGVKPEDLDFLDFLEKKLSEL